MYRKYIIKNGDSFGSIADYFNCNKEELLELNKVYSEKDLRVGREILVPNSEKYFNTYVIETGDSLYKIAKKYNINPTLLASLNGLNMEDYIYPGQEILIPKNNYSYYLTAEGDTLKTVSEMFKIPVSNLVNQNETIYLLKDQILVTRR